MEFIVQVAQEKHIKYAVEICKLIEEAAYARGTGIAKRSPEYVKSKIQEGKAIIALNGQEVAGFCYIETWAHNKYVANSGLIVHPDFRHHGLAKKIKAKAFELSRKKYPDTKIFGITTSLAVMKINSDLGYRPVTFSELTDDENFWKGCQSCPNYDILNRTSRKNCLCTGMLYDPNAKKQEKNNFQKKKGIYERLLRLKRFLFFENNNKDKEQKTNKKDNIFA
ncbi:MAG: GNAT family N-acetyltransferase [Candidatus Cyclobacteriaceae bacterium M3_2C_046]